MRKVETASIARITLVVVGIILLITGFAGLFAGGICFFGRYIFGQESIFAFVVDLLTDQPWLGTVLSYAWIKALAMVVYFLPFIGLMYAGILLVFNLRPPKWHPGLIVFILWLLCIIALGILVFIASASWFTMPIDI